MSEKLRQIAVSQANYLTLKRLGSTGDSFNDVLTEVLKKVKKQQNDAEVGRCDHPAGASELTATTKYCRSRCTQ
jgi:predicted CopG family antitoxin